jgi:folate-binding protein YgfZ
MKAAFLPDRGVVRLSGDDARTLLNGLVTTDVTHLTPAAARFGALLTPQGKIVADFLLAEAADGSLRLDCPRDLAGPLATKLGFYKLRAKVTIENQSETLGILAVWDAPPATAPSNAFTDPRHPDLGTRIFVAPDKAAALAAQIGATIVDRAAYDAHRIACGAPQGGIDFAYGDAFPHETNMDRLHGVDFDKGCYIGQEVVSRMQHRGTARTRTVRLAFAGAAPPPGTAVTAGGKPLGTLGTSADGRALGLLRIDRVNDALAAGQPIEAGATPVSIAHPEDIALPAKGLRV